MPSKKLDETQKNEIIELYRNNISSSKIAKRLDISTNTVFRVLKNEGIEIRATASYIKKLDQNQEMEVVKLYSEGLTIDQITKKLGSKYHAITKILLENNVDRRDIGSYVKKLSKEQEKEIINIYLKQNLSVNKLADKFSVSKKTITKTLKDNNIKILTLTDKKTFTDQQEQEIIDMRQQGFSRSQIAEKFNIKLSFVKYLFKKFDVKNNTNDVKEISPGVIKSKRNKDEDPEIIFLYRKGTSQEKLAELYKINPATIRKILKSNNVKLRTDHSQKINTVQQKEIIKLYEQNISVLKISQKFKVHSSTIKKILQKNDIEIKGSKVSNKKISPDQENKIINLYHQGLSVIKISKKTYTGEQTILRILKKNNIQIGLKNKIKKIDKEIESEIIKLFNDNLTLKKISEIVDVNLVSIRIILKSSGIELKRGRRQNQSLKSEVNFDSKADMKNIGNSNLKLILKKNNIQAKDKPDTNYGETSFFSDSKIIETDKSIKFKVPYSRKLKKSLKKLNESQEMQIIELYSNGLRTRELSEKFSVGRTTINRILHNNQIKKRKAGKFSEKEEIEIIDLYVNQNLTVTDIAEKFSSSKITVAKILKKNSVKILTNKDKKQLTDDQEKEIINLRRQGLSKVKIAKKFNITKSLVDYISRKNDSKNSEAEKIIKPGIKKPRNAPQDLEIVNLYKNGSTQIQLAKLYNMDQSTVKLILLANNIKTRKHPNQKINEEYKKDILRLYSQDFTRKKIAETLNISTSTVKKVLQRSGVKFKETKIKIFSPAQKKEIIDLYQSLSSLKKVGHELNIGVVTIKRVLEECNIEVKINPNRKKVITDPQDEYILNLFNDGVSVNKIAEIINFKPNAIYRILKRNGVKKIKTSKKSGKIDLVTFTNNLKNTGFSVKKSKLQERDQQALKLYAEGLTAIKVAEILSVSPLTIANILKRNNVKTRSAIDYKNKLSEENKVEIIDLYKKGLSMAKIGNMFNVRDAAVRRILKNNKVEIRATSVANSDSRKKFSDQQQKKIIELYQNNVSLEEITLEFNISRSSVMRFLKNNNIHRITDKPKNKIIKSKEKKVVQDRKNIKNYEKEIIIPKIRNIVNKDNTKAAHIIKNYPQQELELKELNKSKLSINEKNILEENKEKVKEQYPQKLSEDQEVKIIKLYKEGYSLKEIMLKFHVSKSYIMQLIKDKDNYQELNEGKSADLSLINQVYDKLIEADQQDLPTSTFVSDYDVNPMNKKNTGSEEKISSEKETHKYITNSDKLNPSKNIEVLGIKVIKTK